MLQSNLGVRMTTSYDRVPYKSYPYAQSQPDRMATVAALLGVRAPEVTTARVLDMGCAGGGNLIPLAERFPEATFVGIDASAGQVAEGQPVIERLGLRNIRLLHTNILDVMPDLGTFDYILSHGVYSWVPPQVREKMLDICRTNLAPNGVAYISYNTYPGWRMRCIIRDIMLYRARRYEDPGDRVCTACAG